MEGKEKEVVNETSESANEQKEKKNAKVAINEFVEKHGKKKCIICGSVMGAAVVALVLGLGIGLGGCNKKAPIVDAAVWKQRANDIMLKHEDADYKAPGKATVNVTRLQKYSYSDGMVNNANENVDFAIDTDNYLIHGKGSDSRSLTGDADKISYHAAGDESYSADCEFWFWVEESERRAYIMATVNSETKSMYFSVTDQQLSDLKTNPDETLYTLCSNCQDGFDYNLEKLGADEFAEYCGYVNPNITVSYMTTLLSPVDFYDEYYNDFMDDGVAYVSGGDFAADYTKKSLELRSSGDGNVAFAFSAVTDEDITDYSSAAKDEVTHISGNCSYELSYDEYNMTGYSADRKASVNLTYDLTAELTFKESYKIQYGKADIKKPTAINLINRMD